MPIGVSKNGVVGWIEAQIYKIVTNWATEDNERARIAVAHLRCAPSLFAPACMPVAAAAVGCCPFLFGPRLSEMLAVRSFVRSRRSVADCFREYRLLTRSRPPAPPAEPEPPFAARSAVHRARSVVLFCGVNFGCTSSIYKRIILPYNLTSGIHCTCIKCGM